MLTARTDGQLLRTPTSLSDSIDRANRFRAAGADCLYVPGVNDLDTIRTLVAEIDGPFNVVIGLGTSTLTVADLQAAGVTRISLGGSIARAALGFIRRSARGAGDEGHDHLRRRPDPPGRAEPALRPSVNRAGRHRKRQLAAGTSLGRLRPLTQIPIASAAVASSNLARRGPARGHRRTSEIPDQLGDLLPAPPGVAAERHPEAVMAGSATPRRRPG